MAWQQLVLTASLADQERFEDALMEAGAQAVSLRDAGDQPLLEPAPGEIPRWDRAELTALFADDLPQDIIVERLLRALGATTLPPYRLHHLDDQDWLTLWQADYHPVHFGGKLWICPHHRPPVDPDAINVFIDPGLAFGTGTHPTTALCLRWLAQTPIAGRRVIDYGCGSGILAIAAAKLGASEVWATDIDPQAMEASAENARRNHVGHQISLVDPEHLPGDADAVLANILAGPLIELAPALRRKVRSGGWIALAGLVAQQQAMVREAYADAFALFPWDVEDNWVLLVGERFADG